MVRQKVDEDEDVDAGARAFADSYSKLLKKGVPWLDLPESVLRARLIRANVRFAEGLSPKAVLSLKEAKLIAGDPSGFDRVLTRWEAKFRRRRHRDGDLTGLPSWTLRRRARSRAPLSDTEARILDESPLGSRVLRNAQKAGIPIESLRQANPAALPKIAYASHPRGIAREAEQFLVELVHRTTRKWFFADVAKLLHCDPKQLEDRSRDFLNRRDGGRELLKSMKPSDPA